MHSSGLSKFFFSYKSKVFFAFSFSHQSTVACGKRSETKCRQRMSMKPNTIVNCLLMAAVFLAVASSKPTPADTGRGITFKNLPSDKQTEASGSIPIYKPDGRFFILLKIICAVFWAWISNEVYSLSWRACRTWGYTHGKLHKAMQTGLEIRTRLGELGQPLHEKWVRSRTRPLRIRGFWFLC